VNYCCFFFGILPSLNLCSRDFIDVREKEESLKRDAESHGRSLMNRWNNEAGRKVGGEKRKINFLMDLLTDT